MVDKDDLFQEEDGIDPQDNDGDKSSSEEDDDIIDLFDTVEKPADALEEDIIELADMVEASENDVIELTEEAQGSMVDDDVLDLTEVVTENENEPEDDVLDLTDIADADDEGVLDLTKKAEESETDDDILDLTEVVAEDEVVDLLDADETPGPGKDLEDDIIEPDDIAPATDSDVLAFTQDIEAPEVDDEIFDSTGTVAEDSTGPALMDQAEPSETMEPVQEELAAETATPPSVGYEEDKELLELIDDIQATLNDEPPPDHVGDRKNISEEDESIDTSAHVETAETYKFLDDNELADSEDIPESETEFVDHLGIDLTSELERKALLETEEAAMEDVKPTEALEPAITPDSLETAVKQALTEMLADENNPLAKAIENAVKKATGQGEST